MNYLERLDIHPTVRSFFQLSLDKITNEEIIINYRDSIEHATANFHRIPITENHWTAGNMAFFSLGAYPTTSHAAIIQQFAPNKKLHFLFSNEPTGALCDLKLASYIRDQPINITQQGHQYQIQFQHKTYILHHLSLNALEKQSHHNFHIRTHKPKKHGTYYQQLRQHHP
jgi:hypothetical protein